jgi:tyrosyl-tRNA synthetase
MTDIFGDLKWRGLIHQTTADDFLPPWLQGGCRTVYAGFDPTAESLHVGSLLPLMLLRRFQKAGHRPIALVGGATGMIGDPSGKSDERNLLSVEQLDRNLAGIETQLRLLLDFDCGLRSAMLVNNHDWIGKFSFTDFLRDVGKNFPVNVMLAKDSIKSRLSSDAGISYTEFSYMLLQAYDFVHLNREFGCELQIGGSDQWGNVTAGIDLGRRMSGVSLYGLTCPLLTKADGTKMGKTESGAVWLSANRTSPYQFYQYWFNVDDADCGKCLRFLTELSHEEIAHLDQVRQRESEKRQSQTRLAEELTRLIHGSTGLALAELGKQIFFGAEIQNIKDDDLTQIFAEVPSNEIASNLIEAGLPILDALPLAGLVKSKGEARRLIDQGGAYVNNFRIEDASHQIQSHDWLNGKTLVLRSGKKKYALLRVKS